MLILHQRKRLSQLLTLLMVVAISVGLLAGCGGGGSGSGGNGDNGGSGDQVWTPPYALPIAGDNETMMQTFYWEMKSNGDHWTTLKNKADFLARIGITSLWIPPASKAWGGIGGSSTSSVGYDVYDLWDLGQYNQMGTVRTKYGTKDQLIAAVKELHNKGIKVYFDAVLNHRTGADEWENVQSGGKTIGAWTKFTFPGRTSNPDGTTKVIWDKNFFNAVDYDQLTGSNDTFLFDNKSWDTTLDNDYIMGADVDYNDNDRAKNDVTNWGRWILTNIGNGVGFDGFRLDAAKHIDMDFTSYWISQMISAKPDAFFVAEILDGSITKIRNYLNKVNQSQLHVFDFPLYYAFKERFSSTNIGDTLDSTKVGTAEGLVNDVTYGDRAVMFADNHDTNRDGQDPGMVNYKYQAYTYMLMRDKGIPCVFWKDFYTFRMGDKLQRLLVARKHFAYGPGIEVEENEKNNVYIYIRDGSETDTEGDGLVMLIAKAGSGIYEQEIDSKQPNTTFYDITGNITEEVTTDSEGKGVFKVKRSEAEGWSVWVPKL